MVSYLSSQQDGLAKFRHKNGLTKCTNYSLGGGNSNIFYFHPEIWGRFQKITNIFFKGVAKKPPTSGTFLG